MASQVQVPFGDINPAVPLTGATWSQSPTSIQTFYFRATVSYPASCSAVNNEQGASRFAGWVTSTDYYDNSGLLYKTISKGRPGPFRVTATANGTTLTQQNVSFTEVVTYNPDGSVRTLTDTGLYNKFTVPGGGIVWLDTGRIVVDGDFSVLFVAGPRQNGDFTAFCAAFR